MAPLKDPEVEGHMAHVVRKLDTVKLGAAFLMLVILLLALFSIKLWGDLNRTVDKLDAIVEARLMEAEAADQQQVDRCYASATQGPILRRVLQALENDVVDARGKADIQEFRRLSLLNTPTIKDCRALAKRLKVPIPEGEGG